MALSSLKVKLRVKEEFLREWLNDVNGESDDEESENGEDCKSDEEKEMEGDESEQSVSPVNSADDSLNDDPLLGGIRSSNPSSTADED